MKAIAWGLLLGLAGPAWAQTTAAPARVQAAEIVLLSGAGSALGSDGQARKLQRGDTLYSGDIVNTGAGSYLNMRFRDGGFVLLRPNTRFQIESYRYQPAAPAAPAAAASVASAPAVTPAPGSHAFLRLLRGGFRAVSGLLGHGQANEFSVTTPVATIGIRGTDYLVILPTPSEAGDPAFSSGGRRIAARGGVLVGVIKGGVFMRNQDGRQMDVGEGQYAMTLKDGTQLLLPFAPDLLKLVPLPDPTQACQ